MSSRDIIRAEKIEIKYQEEKTMNHIPQIRNDNGIPTLYVKGEPFFVLGGEIHNSSASSLEYMERHVWSNLEGLNMNSLIVPLYWETMNRRKADISSDFWTG